MFSPSRHLYPAHLSTIKSRVDEALQKAGFDHLLVASGIEKMRFLDDMPYPFKVSPQFKAWLPLVMNPHCWISYTPGRSRCSSTTSRTTTGTCRRARRKARGSSISTSA